ncbi:putative aspartic-type endopeptidase opsB [Erysiphe necator]|nr:putative aspartic-type endopeptidase opsB [Erysiphe necator]
MKMSFKMNLLFLLTASLFMPSWCTTSSLHLDIQRNNVVRDAQLQKRATQNFHAKRGDSVVASLSNSLMQGLYFANVTVGTPGQNLALQIDTGSSDTWVPSSSATLCRSPKLGGCPDGSFSATQSSTFSLIGQGDFNISYVDNTGAVGDYFQDSFGIGDATLSGFEMGLALQTTIGIGIMGIGYNTSEANTNTDSGGNGTIYQNLPFALVSQGQVKSPAYSLWLNDLESSTGSILFGGVDTEKYMGKLTTVKVDPISRDYGITSFTVAFTSLSATSKSGTDQLTPPDFAVPAILDSGTTITLLPDKIAALIFEELGATPEDQLGAVLVPCDLAKNDGTLSYGFGGPDGPTIKVAVSDLVLPLTDNRGRSPKYKNGQTACQLGIEPAGSLPVLLGDTFLRSAYVVYDLINNQVALAETKFNVTKSNVVPFPSFGASIPDSKTISNEVQVLPTASSTPTVDDPQNPTGTNPLQVEQSPIPTQLNAKPGFLSTNDSKPNNAKKSLASTSLEPPAWPWTVVTCLSLALISVGGVFSLL